MSAGPYVYRQVMMGVFSCFFFKKRKRRRVAVTEAPTLEVVGELGMS